MEVTKNFETFMIGIDVNDYKVLFDLWQAANGNTETLTFFTVDKANGSEDTLITYIPTDNALRLTPAAADYFPTWIENHYMDEMDGESWYGYKYAQEKAAEE